MISRNKKMNSIQECRAITKKKSFAIKWEQEKMIDLILFV